MLPWSVSCCIWEPRLRGVEVVSSLCAVAAGVCPDCVLWLWGLLQKLSVQLKRQSRESLKTQTGCLGHLGMA